MKNVTGSALRIGVAAALALALGGCLGLGGGKPPPVLFGLTASESAAAGATASGKAADAVLVMEPETDRRLAVTRVPVQVDAASVAYLKDALWVERPSRLFRGLLAETLRARGGRVVLEDDQGSGVAGARLGGRLIDMGYDAASQSVVVRYDALKTDSVGRITTRRFESVVPGVPAKAASVGPALNRAANAVAKEAVDWFVGG